MAQVVSIVPALMWLQHRLGHSSFGKDEAVTHPPTQKTIEFTPNGDLLTAKLDTTVNHSFADIEAGMRSDIHKEGSSTVGSNVDAQ